MPNLDLTNAEAAILRWVRAELLRLEGSNNGECGVLVLGNPDQAEAIIREMDHSLDGFSPIPDGETLVSNGRIHAFGTLVE